MPASPRTARGISEAFRAWLRLLAVATVISLYILHVGWLRRFSRHGKLNPGRWTHRYAVLLLRLMNVRILTQGHLPVGEHLLVVGNHRSYTDIFALLYHRPILFLAKQELSEWPLIGRAVRLARTVFVNRECPISRRMARLSVRRLMERRECVAAFPEGTTSAASRPLEFKPGLFWEAVRAGCPVVPVAFEYEHPDDPWVDEASFANHFLAVFGRPSLTIHVAFGPVLQGADGEILRAAAHEWITEKLVELRARFADPLDVEEPIGVPVHDVWIEESA